MDELLQFFGLDKAAPGFSRWIEPADVAAYLGSVLRLPVKVYATDLDGFHRTPREAVEMVTHARLEEICLEHLRKSCKNTVVIDNGTFSYILLGTADTTDVIRGDPHVSSEVCKTKVTISEAMTSRQHWVACLVSAPLSGVE
jgi:hypothetical protein